MGTKLTTESISGLEAAENATETAAETALKPEEPKKEVVKDALKSATLSPTEPAKPSPYSPYAQAQASAASPTTPAPTPAGEPGILKRAVSAVARAVTGSSSATTDSVTGAPLSDADLRAKVESQALQITLQNTLIQDLQGTVKKLETKLLDLTEVKMNLDCLSHDYSTLRGQITDLTTALNSIQSEKIEKLKKFVNLEAISGPPLPSSRSKRSADPDSQQVQPEPVIEVVKKSAYVTGTDDEEEEAGKGKENTPNPIPPASKEVVETKPVTLPE